MPEDWVGSGLSSSSVRGLMGPGFAADPAFATRYASIDRGYVTMATVGANQAVVGGNVLTDVTGLTCSWGAVAGHHYKLTLHIPDNFMAIAGNQQFYIATGPGVWVANQNYAGLPANSNHPVDFFAIVVPVVRSIVSSGTTLVTYKAMCAFQNAATIVQNVGGCPSTLLVEDLG